MARRAEKVPTRTSNRRIRGWVFPDVLIGLALLGVLAYFVFDALGDFHRIPNLQWDRIKSSLQERAESPLDGVM